jgi:hypothetical protein
MATQKDVQRIALSLAGAVRRSDPHFGFAVVRGGKEKLFVWVWLERASPKKPRVPNDAVLAVRVADLDEKDSLLAMDAKKFFTEPHYDGYPAVLVRLAAVRGAELRALITEAWRCVAPKEMLDQRDHPRKKAATSPARSSGSSHAAKWPPRGSSVKRRRS